MENWEEKIDLKQRLTEKNNLSRNGWVTFTTQKLSENSLNELAFFSEMLEKVGISLEVTRKQKAESELCYDFVAMKWNEEKYKTVMNRHAGRKADFEEKYDKYDAFKQPWKEKEKLQSVDEFNSILADVNNTIKTKLADSDILEK